MSTRESVARAVKASKLLWALEAQGKRVGVDATTAADCNNLGELARRMGDAEWRTLADIAGTKPPSEDTRCLVLVLINAKAAYLCDAAPSPQVVRAL